MTDPSPPQPQRHQINFTPLALQMLEAISDAREVDIILNRIEALALSPELQGKPLVGQLRGLRSVRAAGQRYRVVYRVHHAEVLVLVIGVGRRREGNRKDVYAQLERLDPEERES